MELLVDMKASPVKYSFQFSIFFAQRRRDGTHLAKAGRLLLPAARARTPAGMLLIHLIHPLRNGLSCSRHVAARCFLDWTCDLWSGRSLIHNGGRLGIF